MSTSAQSGTIEADAIVIGSGFGGAAAAHSLVRAGWKTLLIERGGWVCRDQMDWDPEAVLIRQRYQSDSPLLVRQYGADRFSRVLFNEVVGGLSVFYGGASMRLRQQDLAGRWPISYAALEPYYTLAEQLLGVHGQAGQDPCEPPRTADYPFPPIPLTEPARRIEAAARQLGLRPFPLPLAINFTDPGRPQCIQCITCDGFPCRVEAKNDLAVTLLGEAQEHGLEIVARTIVRRLVHQGGRIRAVECLDRESGQLRLFSGRIVLLAAGALHSPAILLRSGLERWAQHRLIGRFLMRHCNAVASYVFPFRTNPHNRFHKQLCCTDLYEARRLQLGTAVGVIQDIYTPAAQVLRHAAPRGFKLAAGLFAGFIQNLLCIAEDDPQPDNRVRLATERDRYGMELVAVEHRYSADDCARRDLLVDQAGKILRRAGGLIPYTYKIDTFSHAVGTLRCGTSSDESVLDADCRFWGIDNLFVVDGSFMPASGGVNPSLTIAANALRVADGILRQKAEG